MAEPTTAMANPAMELQRCLARYLQAEPMIDPRGSRVLLDAVVQDVRCVVVCSRPKNRAEDAKPVTLSPREREIARMIAKGLPNKAIASILDISLWTVGTYLRRMFAKLDVNSRAAMIAKLVDTGALELHEATPAPSGPAPRPQAAIRVHSATGVEHRESSGSAAPPIIPSASMANSTASTMLG